MRSCRDLKACRNRLPGQGFRERRQSSRKALCGVSQACFSGCGLRRAMAPDSGQSTVEFAVVTAAFLVLCLGLGAMWHGISDGMFVEHALSSASHHVQSIYPQAAADVLLY